MTQEQIKKYNEYDKGLKSCRIPKGTVIKGVYIQFPDYPLPEICPYTIDLPKEICDEITSVINKWRDYYLKQIEGL